MEDRAPGGKRWGPAIMAPTDEIKKKGCLLEKEETVYPQPLGESGCW